MYTKNDYAVDRTNYVTACCGSEPDLDPDFNKYPLARITHAGVGLAGEVFELAPFFVELKRDYEYLMDEMGDCLWYLAILHSAMYANIPENGENHQDAPFAIMIDEAERLTASEGSPFHGKAFINDLHYWYLELSQATGNLVDPVKDALMGISLDVSKDMQPHMERALHTLAEMCEAINRETLGEHYASFDELFKRNAAKLDARHTDSFKFYRRKAG